MVRSEARITIYEVDGKDAVIGGPSLKLESHWNRNEWILLKHPGAEPITVSVSDLMDAIRRCSR